MTKKDTTRKVNKGCGGLVGPAATMTKNIIKTRHEIINQDHTHRTKKLVIRTAVPVRVDSQVLLVVLGRNQGFSSPSAEREKERDANQKAIGLEADWA